MADHKDDTPDATLEDGAPAEGAEGVDPLLDDGGGKKKKLFMIIGAVAVLLIGGGAGAYFTGLLDGVLGKGGDHGEQVAEGEEAPALDAKGNPIGSSFLPIPDMIVNLNSTDSTPRYLRLSVQLELKNEADKAKVEAVMPRVIDQFQTYLRELRVRDLRGSAGIYRLQMELLARVNEAAHPVVVRDVLFQEILIQ